MHDISANNPGSIMETNLPVSTVGKAPDTDRNERIRQFQIAVALKKHVHEDIGIVWGYRLQESVRTSPNLVPVADNDNKLALDEVA